MEIMKISGHRSNGNERDKQRMERISNKKKKTIENFSVLTAAAKQNNHTIMVTVTTTGRQR